jgi:hypothetical protein
MRNHSLKPHPKAKAKAEKIFHRYIVLRDNRICFTCGKEGNEAGHYKHNKLDFDEINLNCQCTSCNHFKSGNLGEYAVRLIDKYGREKYDDLVFRANTQSNKFSIDELEEITKKYNIKIVELLSSKDLPF